MIFYLRIKHFLLIYFRDAPTVNQITLTETELPSEDPNLSSNYYEEIESSSLEARSLSQNAYEEIECDCKECQFSKHPDLTCNCEV
jgi:hypothetical protein